MNSLAQVQTLYSFLRPCVLRRLKSDVEKNLPSKEEILVEIELTKMQKRIYRAVYERNFSFLTANKKSEGKRQMTALRNISMQLRKVCQHPYLLDSIEGDELEAMQTMLKAGDQLTQDAIMERLVSASGKFLLIDKVRESRRHTQTRA